MKRYLGLILILLFFLILAACQSAPSPRVETNAVNPTPSSTPTFQASSTPAPDVLLLPADLTATEAEAEWQATLAVNQTQNAYGEATRNVSYTQVAIGKTQTALAPTAIPPTPIPVAPPAPLSENGPWLIYYDRNTSSLMAANGDGTGYQTLLTGFVYQPDFAGSVNNQLAVVSPWSEIEAEVPWNTALLIINLPSGEIQDVFPLVTYPGIPEENIPYFYDSLAWSPDGRYLAFIGAINGPSADLYVYDAFTGNVTRLTTGENRADSPQWSPDGKWVIHDERENVGGVCDMRAIWAVRLVDIETQKLYSGGCNVDIITWLDDDHFLGIDRQNGADRDLRLFNLLAGDSIELFSGYAFGFYRESIAWDSISGQVAFAGGARNNEEKFVETYGDLDSSFIVLLSDFSSKLASSSPAFMFIKWFPGANRFIGYPDKECGVAVFAWDIEKSCLREGELAYLAPASVGFEILASAFSISPNGQWLAIASSQGVDLYDNLLERVSSFGAGEVHLGSNNMFSDPNEAWNLASSGFVFEDKNGIYFADMLKNQTYQITSTGNLIKAIWRADSKGVFLDIDDNLFYFELETHRVISLNSEPTWDFVWVGEFPP